MAMTEEPMVVGVFRDHALAEQAMNELRHAGFKNEQINLLGHTSGNALGGIMNLFSSKSTATVAAAPNELASSGLPQGDIGFYERELGAGHFVVTVQPYGHQKDALDILHRHGSYDATADTTRVGSGGSRIVPIREERLEVNKQVVQTGEVIIRKRVITENKTFTVPVTREEVTIERLSAKDITDATRANANRNPGMAYGGAPIQQADVDAANTAMTDGGEILNNGGTIRILVREEQVTLNKQTIVVEEIVVRKQQIQETRELTDTVKREEVRIEHTGNIVIHDGNDVAGA